MRTPYSAQVRMSFLSQYAMLIFSRAVFSSLWERVLVPASFQPQAAPLWSTMSLLMRFSFAAPLMPD